MKKFTSRDIYNPKKSLTTKIALQKRTRDYYIASVKLKTKREKAKKKKRIQKVVKNSKKVHLKNNMSMQHIYFNIKG